jgi:pimeloyl-ACP methyl ester carboxylesterase
MQTPDGRCLDIFDAGDAGQPVVLVHHGTPGARLPYRAWLEDAERKGIRLVAYSRPGYGGSTRLRGRSVSQTPDDVTAIANHLQVSKLATWGYSGGGPPALSCAARLPDLVVAVATIASPAPHDAEDLDFLEGMGQGNIDEFKSLLAGEGAARAGYEKAAATPVSGVEEMIESMNTLLSDPDLQATRDQLGEWLVALRREACSHGPDGWLDDDLAFVRPWGFELSEIRVPLQLWQGQHDLMVPLGHGEWLAQHLPAAEWHYLPDDGHLTPLLGRVPEIHGWLRDHF